MSFSARLSIFELFPVSLKSFTSASFLHQNIEAYFLSSVASGRKRCACYLWSSWNLILVAQGMCRGEFEHLFLTKTSMMVGAKSKIQQKRSYQQHSTTSVRGSLIEQEMMCPRAGWKHDFLLFSVRKHSFGEHTVHCALCMSCTRASHGKITI